MCQRKPEHPRPDFEREVWQNLNGIWNFAFDDEDRGLAEKWQNTPAFSSRIQVPFSYQSALSEIGDTGYHPILWYSRTVSLEEKFSPEGRVFLNFCAVDYYAQVWVDGELAVCHEGGYTPFGADITDLIGDRKHFTIVLRVEDTFDRTQPRGKQHWMVNPTKGCHYHATSGIWQTVWLEERAKTHLEYVHMISDIDREMLTLEFPLSNYRGQELTLRTRITFDGELVTENTVSVRQKHNRAALSIPNPNLWSPAWPNLYDVVFELFENGEVLDRVKSYFGMRKIECRDGQILLNNQILYQRLVLDQGYFPDGILTAPSDEALKADILYAKQMGFNGARKHQKIEEARFYYWADKLGFLLWGELPSGYQPSFRETENYLREMKEFIKRDYNHPSIITWVPLNESWGVEKIYAVPQQQNVASALYYTIKGLDPTRLVSNNDGWEQVRDTDLYGVHDYTAYGHQLSANYADPRKLIERVCSGKMMSAIGHEFHPEKPILITEYGGIAFEDEDAVNWGYNGKVKSQAEFLERYDSITTALKRLPYSSGFCYTQLTDVFQETNGLMDMGRKFKVDPEKIREINERSIR